MDSLYSHPIVQSVIVSGGDWYASLNLSLWELSLIGSLLASWGALVAMLAAMRHIKTESISTTKLCEKLVHDLQVASSSAIGMGQRIIAMENKLQSKSVNGPRTRTDLKPPAVKKATAPPVKENKIPSVATTAPVLSPSSSNEAVAPPNFAALIHSAIVSNDTLAAVSQGGNRVVKSARPVKVNPVSKTRPKTTPKPKIIAKKKKAPMALATKAKSPFDIAKLLLRRGVAQAEVARRCGLSISETALMAMVLNNREGLTA